MWNLKEFKAFSFKYLFLLRSKSIKKRAFVKINSCFPEPLNGLP